MTNKEILQASLLDILFENRNKDYGAYILRRGYNHRLFSAMCSALSAAILLFILMSIGKKNRGEVNVSQESGTVVLRKIEWPADKPPLPKETRTINKPVAKIAGAKFVSQIVIKEDLKAKVTTLPEVKDLENKEISAVNTSGIPYEGTVRIFATPNAETENTDASSKEITFKANEREPEFPGGQGALNRFLKNNLNTPDDLQAGEIKTVHIRFLVGTDGMVSGLEIIQSGGSKFDKEVIRVCKKMPRWKPAFQNGTYVAVRYVLPVTFMGLEQ